MTSSHAIFSREKLRRTPLRNVGLLPTCPPQGQASVEDVSYAMQRLRRQLHCTYIESIQALVAAMEARDPHTRAHSLTVATYAQAIGKRLGLRGSMLRALRSAGLLHDVGKLAVPEAVLTKPGPLTREEFDLIKRHPETAIQILSHVSFLNAEKPMILHHHERFGGGGYPKGLTGAQIPIGARILAVADALDTMLSPRTYKRPYTIDRVRWELDNGAGGQFDPAVIEATNAWLDEMPDELTVPAAD